ncbi:hypothetical protein [Nocardia salmonicida]|uniref:hypothetical protein n=1 Tax=Nocardia salmonicida TaxID=53431 RepID=UPI0033F5ABB5
MTQRRIKIPGATPEERADFITRQRGGDPGAPARERAQRDGWARERAEGLAPIERAASETVDRLAEGES